VRAIPTTPKFLTVIIPSIIPYESLYSFLQGKEITMLFINFTFKATKASFPLCSFNMRVSPFLAAITKDS
jgi:hypothetical protein